MENLDFKISLRTVWILLLGSIILTIVGAFLKILQMEFFQLFLVLGLILYVTSWILIYNDITLKKIYNKKFWIKSMFILPTIAPLVYMFRRTKLMSYGEKHNY